MFTNKARPQEKGLGCFGVRTSWGQGWRLRGLSLWAGTCVVLVDGAGAAGGCSAGWAVGEAHGEAARGPVLEEGDRGGAGKGKMTKELRCRGPRGRQTEPEERRKQEARDGGGKKRVNSPGGLEGKEMLGGGQRPQVGWRGSAAPCWPPCLPQSQPHLLLRVLEGDHQHHIPSLELQLVRVSGCVVVLGLHLQRVGES